MIIKGNFLFSINSLQNKKEGQPLMSEWSCLSCSAFFL
jgi:hypothetical protein